MPKANTGNDDGVAYKIVDLDGDNVKTLFHGLDGSRTLPQHKWLTARVAEVRDGSSKTRYLSGFHVFRKWVEALFYLRKFKHQQNKGIIRCRIRGTRQKEHSPSPVILADEMLILEIVWSANGTQVQSH